MENKKGITTFALIIVIFICLAILVILAIFSYAVGLADDQISTLDVMIGNDSLNDTYQELMHPGVETLRTTVPKTMSISVFLGMVLVLLIIGVKSERKSNIWIILDIIVIIVAEIVAVAIKNSFEDYILNLTPELYAIFTTTLSEGSKWILNLPTIIPTIGVMIIIATYVLKRENPEESENGGFYQIEDEEE